MVKELEKTLKDKYENLKAELRARDKMLVAFSGGVDSALLAKVAKDVLGDSAWAIMVDSETVPKFELEEAKKMAKELGINFEIIRTEQLSDDEFAKNDERRCYFCRKNMAKQLQAFAQKKDINTIAAGAQASDLSDYRPGISAFHENGIWHPFIDLEFTKEDIRNLARYLNLQVAEKPAMACLSSRIPYGEKITQENLEMVAAAEDYLRELGFSQYRARTHENLLRIEIEPNEFEKLIKHRDDIIEKMKALGYIYITLDLMGFKSGSMNETLKNE
jgi:uncharacterized protein